MNVEVSHLVVNGCSYSYCFNLENPKENGWPALLANKLNVPIVNLSETGSSNDAILRRSLEYFHKDKKTNSKPLYIIGWTGSTRREEYYRDLNETLFVSLKTENNPFEKFLVEQLCTEAFVYYEQKKLMYWSSLIDLCKLNNIPYVMTDFIPFLETERQLLQERFPEFYDYVINDYYNLPNVRDSMYDNKDKYLMQCGHYNKEGNKVLADFFYDEILKRYTIEPTEKEYYKIQKNNDWS